MKKDILDKLELKNYENLSSNRINDNSLGINRDLDHLKINDDFSNDEWLEDEFGIVENNSYIDLSETLEKEWWLIYKSISICPLLYVLLSTLV